MSKRNSLGSSLDSYVRSSNIPELKENGIPHYAVVEKRRYILFDKRSELYGFPVLILQKEDGSLKFCGYYANSKCEGNGHEKKLEVKTFPSPENSKLSIMAQDGNSPWGIFRKKLRVIKVDNSVNEKIESHEVEIKQLG